jgi:CHASE2 domain-containing sensor protein
MIIVGVDEASVRAITVPPGLWHEPIGRALERIAAARPRAIGIDVPLPDRSYEAFHAGLDAPLLRGLLAARGASALVASLGIDPKTRSARPIHTPFLAVLGAEGLGIGLLGRDLDGATRRFSLAIPTEDGAYPTLAGRLCRALSRQCSDGLIDYARGEPFKYVPLRDVLATQDVRFLERLFRDRIVLIGDVRPGDRVAVPVNLAGWEPEGRESPAVVVHAQSLRTALLGAPTEAARPLSVLLVALAALIAFVRRPAIAWATLALAAVGLLLAATVALRAAMWFGISGALVAAVLAAAWSSYRARRLH